MFASVDVDDLTYEDSKIVTRLVLNPSIPTACNIGSVTESYLMLLAMCAVQLLRRFSLRIADL